MATVLQDDPLGDGAVAVRVEVSSGAGGEPEVGVACRIERARLRFSEIRWIWSGVREPLGGVAGGCPDGAGSTGECAGGERGGGEVKTG